MEVTELVGSKSLLLAAESEEEDEESGRLLNRDSTNDEKSVNCRDSSCSDELLDDSEVDEDVGTAGVVTLVTIWRLTCRGK